MKGKSIYSIILILILFFSYSSVNSYNSNGSVNSFINSPSINKISTIKDRIERVCEQVFLEAYMRREFSDLENRLCSNIFSLKIEAEMNYKYTVLGKRGIFY